MAQLAIDAAEHLFPPFTPEKNAELKTWFESPGAHHRISVNASYMELARLLAVLVGGG